MLNLGLPIGWFWSIIGIVVGICAFFYYISYISRYGNYKFLNWFDGLFSGFLCVLVSVTFGLITGVIFSRSVYLNQTDTVVSTNVIVPFSDVNVQGQSYVFVYDQALKSGGVQHLLCVVPHGDGSGCKNLEVSSTQSAVREYEEGSNNYPVIEFHRIETNCSSPTSKIAGFFVGCLKVVKEVVWIIVPKGSIV